MGARIIRKGLAESVKVSVWPSKGVVKHPACSCHRLPGLVAVINLVGEMICIMFTFLSFIISKRPVRQWVTRNFSKKCKRYLDRAKKAVYH